MRILLPSTGRTTLALLAVIPAAMAYPWHGERERWVLAVAGAVILVLFGWWRGLHLTTIWRRRAAMLFRGGRNGGVHQTVNRAGTDARTTAVLRVLDGPDTGLPLDLVHGYLNRYGIHCESLRITSHETPAGRTTWIGLTMTAGANLAALQARSTEIPLRGTAEITLRRLADQLREQGWTLTTSDLAIPETPGPGSREHWRAVADGGRGYLAAYGLAADRPSDVLNSLWSRECIELWTAIEMSAAGLAAGCAIRTETMPAATPPLTGLLSRRGNQRKALQALMPGSTNPLHAEIKPANGFAALRWPANGYPVP